MSQVPKTEKITPKIIEVKYFISKSLSEIYQLETFDKLEEALNSIPEEEKNSKWNCFAKYKTNVDQNYKYSHLYYYDCISPLGDVSDTMKWYKNVSNKKQESSNLNKKKLK